MGWGTCASSMASGSDCSFLCAAGHSAVEGHCFAGSWQTAPACYPNPCNATLPATATGWGSCSARTNSSTNCSFACKAGYTRVWGLCTLGVWQTTPSCTPDPCPLARPVTASGWGTCSQSVASGATCAFTCLSGFSAVAGVCSAGSWATAPACSANPCKLALPSTATGWGTCTGAVPSGGNCTFDCSRGHTAVGGECTAGLWDATPSCSPDPCNLTLAQRASGWGTCAASLASGLTCSFACVAGHSAVAGVCAAGTWTSAPSCTPNPCTLSLLSTASGWGNCSESVASGQACAFLCPTGYTVVGGSCVTGTWTTTPTCSANPCGLTKPATASGWGTCSATVASGRTCAFDCLGGHSAPSGMCVAGSWASTPACTPNPCTLSLPSTASGWGTCSQSVASGTNCSFLCPAGYTVVGGSCATGTWATTPTCSANPCNLTMPATAAGWGTCEGTMASGETCTLVCGSGYSALSGLCVAGAWETTPTCRAAAAGASKAVIGGIVGGVVGGCALVAGGAVGALMVARRRRAVHQATLRHRVWHCDKDMYEELLAQERPEALQAARPADVARVVEAYYRCPCRGLDVARVETVFSRGLETAFESRMGMLSGRDGNPAFAPQWSQDRCVGLRSQIVSRLGDMAAPTADSNYPGAKLLLTWHGTSPEVLGSVVTTGYASLATTDAGFFGKGVYSAYEARYAYQVYCRGALLVNWVSFYSAYPVVDGDMDRLLGKSAYANYDAHFVPVCPSSPDEAESNFYPVTRLDEAVYHEMVVFEASQCLPRYVVTLQPNGLHTATLPALPAAAIDREARAAEKDTPAADIEDREPAAQIEAVVPRSEVQNIEEHVRRAIRTMRKPNTTTGAWMDEGQQGAKAQQPEGDASELPAQRKVFRTATRRPAPVSQAWDGESTGQAQ
eukprot:m51a1_g4257 putative p-selectin isoform x1 (906) ;mRNA; r:231725-234442